MTATRDEAVGGGQHATSARMYDYYLGGEHWFPADQVAAERVIANMPQIREMARANRAFLRRAVRYLAQQGAHQFLDIGSGIPTMGNVHEIAQSVNPQARTLYVDLDPVAVWHSRQLLAGNDLAYAIEGDLREPATLVHQIATDDGAAAIIDFDQPVAVILAAVLHFVPDDTVAYSAVKTLRAKMAPGSWLVISQGAQEGFADEEAANTARVYAQSTKTPAGLRTREGIAEFFDGFTLIEPGLVWLPLWRPAPGDPLDFVDAPERMGSLGGVGVMRTGNE